MSVFKVKGIHRTCFHCYLHRRINSPAVNWSFGRDASSSPLGRICALQCITPEFQYCGLYYFSLHYIFPISGRMMHGGTASFFSSFPHVKDDSRRQAAFILLTKKRKVLFQNTKAPTSLEIWTRNLREVIGHGQT